MSGGVMFYWGIEKRLALAAGMIGVIALLCGWAMGMFS